jgi:hypothetical protein
VRTEKTVQVGELLLVLRSDGGVYLGRPDQSRYGGPASMTRDVIRLGSSAAFCHALSSALLEMERHIRGTPEPGECAGIEPDEVEWADRGQIVEGE